MSATYKPYTDFLLALGIDKVPHSQKSYLAHLVNVYRLMEDEGCTPELCAAGMFHSIYGTEKFQGFKLELDQRDEVRRLIGDRAERLGYLNCAMDRASFDAAALGDGETYEFIDRISQEKVILSRRDFDDLARVHLFDWFEQVERSRYGWDYRRAAYRQLARRLGAKVEALYERVFARELGVARVQMTAIDEII